jgi:hypothetical protein
MDRMAPVPESSAGPVDRAVANDYDSFAEAYTAETEANLINGYYAPPAILDVAGRRILDAGCGAGPLAAALRDRGCTSRPRTVPRRTHGQAEVSVLHLLRPGGRLTAALSGPPTTPGDRQL